MADFICRLVDLPPRVRAVVLPDDNGFCSIFVNAKLSSEEQKAAFEHEKRHILKNHFYKDLPVKTCENEAKDD